MRKRLLLLALGVGLLGVILYAQEPARFERGLNIIRGNIIVSTGGIRTGTDSILAGGTVRDTRTVTTITDKAAATYTAAQVLTGIIVSDTRGTDRTDVLPTAALLVAALPSDQRRAGASFLLAVESSAPAGGALALNGAATGVTYGSNCGTSIPTNEGMIVLLTVTTATSGSEAVRATCIVPQ